MMRPVEGRHSPRPSTCCLVMVAVMMMMVMACLAGVVGATRHATTTTSTTNDDLDNNIILANGNDNDGDDDGDDNKHYTNLEAVNTSTFRVADFDDLLNDDDLEYDNLYSSRRFKTSSSARRQKRAIRSSMKWPKGILPYVIEPDVRDREPSYQRVMAQFESHSCIRYVPWNATRNQQMGLKPDSKMTFIKDVGCYTSGTLINCCTGLDCLHEMGHMLGFPHEHMEPDRNGWIRINPENLAPGDRAVYDVATASLEDYPYDLSSEMNYLPWMDSNGRPTLTVLFPELKVGREYYYMFKQIASHYKCYEKEPCKNFNLACVNDGFVTVFYGQCACMCPQGLDPDTGCSTPLNKESREFKMPRGQYALPMPKTGCPEDTFQQGHVTYFGNGKDKVLSSPSNMKVDIKGATAEQYFCTRNVHDDDDFDQEEAKFNWPVGQYCIYRKGGQCPEGLYPGFVRYDGNTPPTDGGTTFNSPSGELPDGVYGNDSIKLELCCQYTGFTPEPIALPNKKPLALFRLASSCQEAEGMHVSNEEFVFNSDDDKKTFHVEGRISHKLDRDGKRLSLQLCYYTPVDRDCGAAITLNATHRETTIEVNSTGRTDMDCSWIVKGSSEKGTLVLNFEEFDVKTKGNDGKTCEDTVEVRHARIGALGLKYCGTKVGQSIRTITDKALIRLSTYRASTSSFKLKVKWIPDAALCYNVDDGGASYTGTVNYTRTFTPCLPWAQVTKCHHHPFQRGDEMANLDGNYCRNPDDSFRPWCYTDTDGCKRNYCDVCKLETSFDRDDDCQEMRKNGFCTRNTTDAVRSCAATCYDLLPSTGPVEIYSQLECGPPTPPSGSEVVGKLKSKYLLGEKVEFRCKRDRSYTLNSTCLTDGNWTAVDACRLECPLGHDMYNNSCYHLVNNGETFHFDQGQKKCKSLGGSMAVPRSYQEGRVILSARRGHVIWLSANDIAIEGTWVYEDGERITWSNWAKGMPNTDDGAKDCAVLYSKALWKIGYCWWGARLVCAIPKLDQNECRDFQVKTCSGLTKARPSMCQDFPDYAKRFCPETCGLCGSTNVTCSVKPPNPDVSVSTTDTTISVGSFVTYSCERYTYYQEGDRVQFCRADGQLDGKSLVCGDCPLGFVHVNGSCHRLLQRRQLTFSQAKDECRKLGGFVAYPRNEAENDFIHSIAAPARLWLGINRFRGDFQLGNGLPVSWSNWASGESRGSGEDCIVMTDDKKWHYSTCDKILQQVICTVQRSGKNAMCYDEESLGRNYNGDVNYTKDYTPCLPWVDVAGVCSRHPFRAGDERDNLESNYCRNPDASDRPWCYTEKCWWKYCDVCGLEKPRDQDGDCKKLKEEGFCLKDVAKATLRCASTCHDLLPSSGPTESYLNIRCDTPIPPPDEEIVGATKSKYRLGDRVGLKCKRNQNVVYTTCLTSGEWSPVGLACQVCPDGYDEFNNTCYGFVDKELDYQDAQEECRKYGGHLPRPVTQAENAFIHTRSNGHDIWLGGKYNGGDSFLWNDGTKIEETHWRESGPKNNGACIYMARKKGQWDDTDCTDYTWPELRLVCAVPKLDNVLCRDFLGLDHCQELLVGRPSMCGDYPDFAGRYCQQTCGTCPMSG